MIGNIVLTYISNGNLVPIIHIREILIASLGLLFIPKNIKINIEEMLPKSKMLPNAPNNMLEQRDDAIYKLNSMSETISQIADVYKDVAATVVEDRIEVNKEDKQIFIDNFLNSIENMADDNMLYDDLIDLENNILEELFERIIIQDEITDQDLIDVFELHNIYILSVDDKDLKQEAAKDIFRIVKTLNYTYKVNKLNFIWRQKINDSKKTMSNQLDGVSKVISNLASEMEEKKDYRKQKEELKSLITQKGIEISDMEVKQDKNGKYIIDIYSNILEGSSSELEKTKKIEGILSKFFDETVVLQKQRNRINEEENLEVQAYSFEDKYGVQIGSSKTKKNDSAVSGDSILQTKLDDGKYLLAISDGMGSGLDAKKASNVAIKVLKRLLTAGFDKDASLELINSTLYLNANEDMYATLDVAILDLYAGVIEIIKNGAMPTYIKNEKEVETVENDSLPAGLVNELNLVVHTLELKDEDIIVMVSDGIIESDPEKRENWIKDLLKTIKIDNAQKIADIILQEAVDNNFGMAKDDMTVVVARISKK